MQAFNSSTFIAIKLIYAKKGVLGFYNGFLINSARVTSKQAYRWPLNIALLSFLK